MIIVITGLPRSGKTTLVEKIISSSENSFLGFITKEIREKNKRLGFKIITTWKTEFLLAHVNYSSKYKVSKYGVCIENIEKVISELEERINERKILVIDEIGKMELLSKKFEKFVSYILDKKDMNFLVTIPKKSNHYLVKKIRNKASKIFDLDVEKVNIENVLKNFKLIQENSD